MGITTPILESLIKGALSNWRGRFASNELDEAAFQLVNRAPTTTAEVVQILTDALSLEGAEVLAVTEVAPEVLVLLAV